MRKPQRFELMIKFLEKRGVIKHHGVKEDAKKDKS